MEHFNPTDVSTLSKLDTTSPSEEIIPSVLPLDFFICIETSAVKAEERHISSTGSRGLPDLLQF